MNKSRAAGPLPGAIGAMQAEVAKAYHATMELLPRVAPDRPRFLLMVAEACDGSRVFPGSATGVSNWPSRAARLERFKTMLPVAEKQGSDLYVALAAYHLVATVLCQEPGEGAIRPSTPWPGCSRRRRRSVK